MTQAFVKNAADPEQVKSAQKRAEIAEREHHERVRRVFGGDNADARRLLSEWLEKSACFPTLAFSKDPVEQARFATAFHVARQIIDDLNRVDPNIYVAMQTERIARELKGDHANA